MRRWVKEDKDEENIKIREGWRRKDGREDTKTLFASLTASISGGSSRTELCCPRPHKLGGSRRLLDVSSHMHTCADVHIHVHTDGVK